jgi:hypothetical protein
VTVNRFCSSGLQTIAMAAQRIIAGEADVFVAGGVESISCVQQEMNLHMIQDLALAKQKPEIYWSMLQTAEQVAKRYNIGREAMDEYGAASQQKACARRPRPVRRRNRPHHRDGRRGRQDAGPDHQASHGEQGRRHARRHDGGRPSAACARRCPAA